MTPTQVARPVLGALGRRGEAQEPAPVAPEATGKSAAALEAPPRRRARRGGAGRRVLVGSAVPVLTLVGWQLCDNLRIFPKALIPPPLTVLATMGDWLGVGHGPQMFYTGHLLSDGAATLLRVLVGFGLAGVFGVALGTAIGVSRHTEEALTPMLRILGPVPPITWIPVAIVVFGIGELTNYFLTFLGAVFPVVAATAVAVSGVGRDLLRAGRMLGLRRLKLVGTVVLPAALPGITGGLRIGLGLSWMMAVTSEMLAVHSGLGYTLWNAYNYLDYPAVFAAMIVTGVCGLATDTLLRLATRRALRWHVATGVRS